MKPKLYTIGLSVTTLSMQCTLYNVDVFASSGYLYLCELIQYDTLFSDCRYTYGQALVPRGQLHWQFLREPWIDSCL